jgi:hypothetical protein
MVTLRVGNRSSRNIYFAKDQKVQALVAKTWGKSEDLSPMADSFLLPQMEQACLPFFVPPRTETCRVLLTYNTTAPDLRATEFFSKHGWYGRFPKLCKWIVKRLPHKAGWRHIAPEVKLPGEAQRRESIQN